jgi:hypothetical protein
MQVVQLRVALGETLARKALKLLESDRIEEILKESLQIKVKFAENRVCKLALHSSPTDSSCGTASKSRWDNPHTL